MSEVAATKDVAWARRITEELRSAGRELEESSYQLSILKRRHPKQYAQVTGELGLFEQRKNPPKAPVVNDSPRNVVYFVQAGTDGPIKIGTATDLLKRVSALQTGNAATLHILGFIPGGPYEESAMHDRFSHLRIRGEWFQSSPELLDFVKEQSK